MTAMCCELFDFALSSNCYVDSLNDVCSRINMGLRAALIKGRNGLCCGRFGQRYFIKLIVLV